MTVGHRTRWAVTAALLLFNGAAAWAWSGNWSWSWQFPWVQRLQASGEMVTESRTPGSFEALAVSGPFKVRVQQSSREAVELKADKNLLPLIETRLIDRAGKPVMEVRWRDGVSWSGPTPEVAVEVRHLRGVSVSGSGDVQLGGLKAEQLEVSVAGSGDVAMGPLQVQRLTLRISGSGDIRATGQCEALTVDIAGSGDVEAAGLVAQDVTARVAGSGNAQVQAHRRLQVRIAGSGDVRYAGAAAVESSIAGSGSIKKLTGP